MKKRVLAILISILVVSIGIFGVKALLAHASKAQAISSAPKPEQVKTVSQQDSSANQDLQSNAQSIASVPIKTFLSNFTYTHNKDMSIQDNVAAESLEGNAIKQWDTRLVDDDGQWNTSLSGDSYTKTFEKLFSLHPAISGSASLLQALTFGIKDNVPFTKLSADELQKLFGSVMMLDGYIYPQMSAIITVVDPAGNKIYFAVYKMNNGYSAASLSGNDKTVWQVLMGKNASESMLEDGAKKFNSSGQELYNVFHGSTIKTQPKTSAQDSTNISVQTPTQTPLDTSPQIPAQPPIITSPQLPMQSQIVVPHQTPIQKVTISQPNVYPNVKGKTIKDALDILKQDNISPDVIYVDIAPGPAGIVLDMEPKAGEQVVSVGGGHQVIITVSGKGP